MKHGSVICKQLALGKSWTNFTSKQQKQSSFHFQKDQRKQIIKEKTKKDETVIEDTCICFGIHVFGVELFLE